MSLVFNVISKFASYFEQEYSKATAFNNLVTYARFSVLITSTCIFLISQQNVNIPHFLPVQQKFHEEYHHSQSQREFFQ